MRLLVVGGCGFVGSNFIRHVLGHYGPEMITNVDALTTGRLVNLKGIAATFGERYEFLHADIANAEKIDAVLENHQFYAVVHFAAESSGASGTELLLDRARRHGVRRFLLVSKDGDNGARAASEKSVLVAHRDHGHEVVITRASDNYGQFQPPTGLIPNIILSALHNQPVQLSGDGSQVRDWLHVEDHCAALFTALLEGQPGGIYQFAAGSGLPDIELVHRILEQLGQSRESIVFQSAEAAVPVRRHAAAPLSLDWKPRHSLEQGMRDTVDWYVRNREWWQPLLNS
jgi:dTDP-glucose 4,6-dehydratase